MLIFFYFFYRSATSECWTETIRSRWPKKCNVQRSC